MTRDDYDRVWAYDQEAEQARWDEAQDEAREASADRFERSDGAGRAGDHSGVPAMSDYKPLPPMTTEDKIAATVVLAILLLGTGALWACIFFLAWAFTGWKP